MTSKERVLATLNHEQPDRVAIDYWFRDDVKELFKKFIGVETDEGLYQFIHADLRTVEPVYFDPEFEDRTNGVLGDAVELTGGRFIFHEDGTFEDIWGTIRRNGKDGLYTEWVSGPYRDNDDFDAYTWPSIEIVESQASIRTKVEQIQTHGELAIKGYIDNPFKHAWQMRGLENTLCDMLVEPEFCSRLMWKCASYAKEMGLRLIRAGVDILGIVGDIASQTSLLFSLDCWRQFIRPCLDDMIQAFKEENPDVHLFFHSDGCLDMIMPELIDTGFDIINPIQPECMDLFRFKDDYGDKVTIHGGISIQELLPFGSVEDVHREVRAIIDYCNRDGGYILCPANLVQLDTPMENILALYEEAVGTTLL
ncbi:MAG: uroporphyrinogen decarboxylase family protein [Bacilli bacterium]